MVCRVINEEKREMDRFIQLNLQIKDTIRQVHFLKQFPSWQIQCAPHSFMDKYLKKIENGPIYLIKSRDLKIGFIEEKIFDIKR